MRKLRVPVVCVLVILGLEIVRRSLREFLPFGHRFGVVLYGLLNPAPWVCVWIAWTALLGRRNSLNREEAMPILADSRRVFLAKYFRIVLVILPVVFIPTLLFAAYGFGSFYVNNAHLGPTFPWLWCAFASILLDPFMESLVLALLTPGVVAFFMTAFPRSTRGIPCIVESGLAVVLVRNLSFWSAMMLIILKARYDLFRLLFSWLGVVQLQILMLAIALIITVVLLSLVAAHLRHAPETRPESE